MKYLKLDTTIFINNRLRFIKQMKPNSIAIFVSNDEWPSNGDAIHRFKQNSDLFWLTGMNKKILCLFYIPIVQKKNTEKY